MSARTVVTVLELAGLYVFATSGALLAIQKGFDLVGILILAMLTALGGGILRDLIIGDTPPAAFTDVMYLVVPVVAAVVTFFAHPGTAAGVHGARLRRGRARAVLRHRHLKALDLRLDPLQAVLLGVTTAVGGGVLRDIAARETPALVQVETDLYAIPAAAGAVLVAAAYHTDLPVSLVATGAAVFVFAFRIVAMLRHWRAPRARVRQG